MIRAAAQLESHLDVVDIPNRIIRSKTFNFLYVCRANG
jgi:hypothetical protein